MKVKDNTIMNAFLNYIIFKIAFWDVGQGRS